MMTDMLETVTALGIIEALVLDLPVALAMRKRAVGPTVEEGKLSASRLHATLPSGCARR